MKHDKVLYRSYTCEECGKSIGTTFYTIEFFAWTKEFLENHKNHKIKGFLKLEQ